MFFKFTEINAIEQKIELFGTQYDRISIDKGWPFEPLFFQTLIPNDKSISLPRKQLDFVSSFATKDKNFTAAWVSFHFLLNNDG